MTGAKPITHLTTILDKMADLQGAGDPEASHENADALLIEALEFMGAAFGGEVEETIHAITDLYQRVPKWYA